MDAITREWAGKARPFRLSFGGVLDLEAACGGVAFGEIFQRVSVGRFFAGDIRNIIRLGLIGAGMSVDQCDKLISEHFDVKPFMVNAALAQDILSAAMTGIEESDGAGDDSVQPMKFSEVSQICRVFNISVADLREMRFADFMNLMIGFNAAMPDKLEPITEAEFDDILARYEQRDENDG